MIRSVMAVLFVVALCLSSAQAEVVVGFDKLFTTAQQRQAIDADKRHYGLRDSTQQTNVEVAKKLVLNAVVLGAKKVVWVNQKMVDHSIEVNGISINPASATLKGVWLSTPQGKRFLQLGQVYLIESGKVVEAYEAL